MKDQMIFLFVQKRILFAVESNRAESTDCKAYTNEQFFQKLIIQIKAI